MARTPKTLTVIIDGKAYDDCRCAVHKVPDVAERAWYYLIEVEIAPGCTVELGGNDWFPTKREAVDVMLASTRWHRHPTLGLCVSV